MVYIYMKAEDGGSTGILKDSENLSFFILSSDATKASHLFSRRTDASTLATLQLTACMSGMAGAKTTGPRKGDTVGEVSCWWIRMR